MPNWIYRTTKHRVNGSAVKSDSIIECNAAGSCLVHDITEMEMQRLNEFFNEQGAEGWELIQCTYHDKELFCLWKKEAPKPA